MLKQFSPDNRQNSGLSSPGPGESGGGLTDGDLSLISEGTMIANKTVSTFRLWFL